MVQEATWSLRYLWTCLIKDPAFVEVISIFLIFSPFRVVFKTPKLVLKWSTKQWCCPFFGQFRGLKFQQVQPKKDQPKNGNGRLIHSFFLHPFNNHEFYGFFMAIIMKNSHLIIIFQISWLFPWLFHIISCISPWLPGDRFQRISGQVWFLLYANGSWPAKAAVTGGQACGQALWRVATLILCVVVEVDWWIELVVLIPNTCVYCVYIYICI